MARPRVAGGQRLLELRGHLAALARVGAVAKRKGHCGAEHEARESRSKDILTGHLWVSSMGECAAQHARGGPGNKTLRDARSALLSWYAARMASFSLWS